MPHAHRSFPNVEGVRTRLHVDFIGDGIDFHRCLPLSHGGDRKFFAVQRKDVRRTRETRVETVNRADDFQGAFGIGEPRPQKGTLIGAVLSRTVPG